MRRRIKRATAIDGKTHYIEKKGKTYVAYRSMLDILRNHPSPNLNTAYSQKEKQRAYNIGLLNKTY